MIFCLMCRTLVLAVLSLFVVANVFAQEKSVNALESYSSLSGLSKFIDTNITYINDFQSNQNNQAAKNANIGAFEAFLSSDLSKYTFINGNFNIHFVHVQGTNPSEKIGDIQMTSNISAPQTLNRISDLWYEQILNDNNKLLFGVHDISSEFYITNSSLNFTHASFGTGAELSSSGVHGPSLYPVTTIGIRHLLTLENHFQLRSAVYDADPTDTGSKAISYKYNREEGIFFISELTRETEKNKSGISSWSYDKKQAHIESPDFRNTKSFGAYLFHEENLLDNVSVFARFGWANPRATPIKNNFVAGTVWRGIVQRDLKDEIGLGFTQVRFSKHYLRGLLNEIEEANSDLDEEEKVEPHLTNSEQAIELYYQFNPMEMLTLRPDFQYVKNPSGDEDIPDAAIIGFRAQINI